MIIITNNSLVPTKRKRNENENKRQPRMTMTLSEARLAVSQCEQEIQTLKATLRRIGMTSTTTTTGGGDGDEEEEENTTATQNKVEITFTKVRSVSWCCVVLSCDVLWLVVLVWLAVVLVRCASGIKLN